MASRDLATSCDRLVRRAQVAGLTKRLPEGWQGCPVQAAHSKACSSCGFNDWDHGMFYFTSVADPIGAPKLCENCIVPYAIRRGWLQEGEVQPLQRPPPARLQTPVKLDPELSSLTVADFQLPPGWRGAPVLGEHFKSCTLCGCSKWEYGTMYYTDFVNPSGADKLCGGCIVRYALEEDWPRTNRFLQGVQSVTTPQREYERRMEGWAECDTGCCGGEPSCPLEGSDCFDSDELCSEGRCAKESSGTDESDDSSEMDGDLGAVRAEIECEGIIKLSRPGEYRQKFFGKYDADADGFDGPGIALVRRKDDRVLGYLSLGLDENVVELFAEGKLTLEGKLLTVARDFTGCITAHARIDFKGDEEALQQVRDALEDLNCDFEDIN